MSGPPPPFAAPFAAPVAFIPAIEQPIFQPGASITDSAVQTAQTAQALQQTQIANAAIAAQQAEATAAALDATNKAAAATLAQQQAASAKTTIVLTGESNSFAPGTAPGTVGSLSNAPAGTGLLSPAGEDNLAKQNQPGNSTPSTPAPTPPPTSPPILTLPPATSDLVASASPPPFVPPVSLQPDNEPVDGAGAAAAPLQVALTPIAPPSVVPPLDGPDFSNSLSLDNPTPEPTNQPVLTGPPAGASDDATLFGATPLAPPAPDPLAPPSSVQALLSGGTSLTPGPDGADPLHGFTPSQSPPPDQQPITGNVNPDITTSSDDTLGKLPVAPATPDSTMVSTTNGDIISATAGGDTSTPLAFISPDGTAITTTNPNSGITTTDSLADPTPAIVSSDTDVVKSGSAAATIIASQVRTSLGLLTPLDNAVIISNAVGRNQEPLKHVLTDVANQMGIGPAQGGANQIAAFIQGVMAQDEGQPRPDDTINGTDFQDLVAPPPIPVGNDVTPIPVSFGHFRGDNNNFNGNTAHSDHHGHHG